MQFVVSGRDILNGPSVGTLSGAGNNGQGQIRVEGGTQIFESTQIIVFDAVNLTADGEIVPGGAISDVTVCADLLAFEMGTPLYTYRPQNPGQTANVQSDLSGLGDGYVRFNANVLIPENGGPSFSQLLVAPGKNLATRVTNGETVVIDRNEDFDFNFDDDFDDPLEQGNNQFFVGNYVSNPVCFVAGSMIRTPDGDREVETLRPGDRVITLDHGIQRLVWVGQADVPALGRNAPIRIAKGTFGAENDLWLSPNHRILSRSSSIAMHFQTASVLVAAKHLVGRPGITQDPRRQVCYVHLQFPEHELIWSNGLLCESLTPRAESAGQIASLLETQDLIGPTARRCLTASEARLLR